ncbi:MAG: citrate/2-methylcitrate synthase [Evtepia sp.]
MEELGIPLVQERRGHNTPMCANVDMYSGLVYTMLGIPEDVFTPLFASARIAGWCANRMEELITCHRIMRPAYRAVVKRVHYASHRGADGPPGLQPPHPRR